jgi:transcriptional regulator with XRE-family HTH domain
MTPNDLRAWQARMGFTYETAAEALGISRSGFAKLLAGDHPIDKRTALACAALAAGVEEWRAPSCPTSNAPRSGSTPSPAPGTLRAHGI